MSYPVISDCLILNEDDYTFYSKRRKRSGGTRTTPNDSSPDIPDIDLTKLGVAPDQVVDAAIECGECADASSLSFSCALKDSQTSDQIKEARLLAASCFRGRWWSVTVRSNKRAVARGTATRPAWRESKYVAKAEYPGNTLFSISDVCQSIQRLLFSNDKLRKPGAVIVTGATASCKSLITKGLIDEHLRWCVERKQKRKPHLVTIEDPIETWFLPIPTQQTPDRDLLAEWPIDYTPRELPTDVATVSQALKDALRQSPSAVFISEIRNDRGWQSLMEFAGTGHLIFATGHAGSLPEAMGKILKAHKAKTAADRAVLAERILGLVHVKLETIGPGTSALMVTLWRRAGAGKQLFISDGISALAPQAGSEHEISSFGRHWFAEQLLSSPAADEEIIKLRTKLGESVLQRARMLDMEGL